jgi:hypothetical protein
MDTSKINEEVYKYMFFPLKENIQYFCMMYFGKCLSTLDPEFNGLLFPHEMLQMVINGYKTNNMGQKLIDLQCDMFGVDTNDLQQIFYGFYNCIPDRPVEQSEMTSMLLSGENASLMLDPIARSLDHAVDTNQEHVRKNVHLVINMAKSMNLLGFSYNSTFCYAFVDEKELRSIVSSYDCQQKHPPL